MHKIPDKYINTKQACVMFEDVKYESTYYVEETKQALRAANAREFRVRGLGRGRPRVLWLREEVESLAKKGPLFPLIIKEMKRPT